MWILSPTLLKNRITDITADDLHALGVEGLLLDVDNTLTKFHSQELSPEVELWLKSMEKAGFKMMVVSNGFAKRVLPFTNKINLPAVSLSCKPSPIGFWRAAKQLKLPLKKVIAIGDQIFTDVIGAHLAGIKIIQVLPIELEYNRPTIMLKRKLEKPLVAHYIKKHGDIQ